MMTPLRLLSRSVPRALHRSNPARFTQIRSKQEGGYDGDGKTTISFLNQEQQEEKSTLPRILFDGIAPGGFILNNGAFCHGSVAAFPRTVLPWNVFNVDELTEAAFSLFLALQPKLDLLVLGIGDKGCRCPDHILQFLLKEGLRVEVLPSEMACTTFNYLTDERRWVAAALIAPKTVEYSAVNFASYRERQRMHRSDADDQFDEGSDSLFSGRLRGEKTAEKINKLLLDGQLDPALVKHRLAKTGKKEREKMEERFKGSRPKDEDSKDK